MSESKVIITDCDHGNIDTEKQIFEKESIPFELKQCKTEEDLIEYGKGVEVFINQYAPINENVLSHLPDLKLVVRYGVGVNNIDLDAADKYKVQICNIPDYGMNEVADHALALMLYFTRKIGTMTESVKEGEWDYQKSIPIYRHKEQTIGIIGVGRIGASFAKKVKALGCNVIGYDTNSYNQKRFPDFINMVSLDELLKTADIVSIHCPLDKAHHLISERELKLMKSEAFLINVSRGGIINEFALDQALQEEWIAGAAVDVAENEPMPSNHNLLRYSNFLCTPHMAWYSEQAALELKRKVAEESVRFLDGKSVHYPINNI